MLGLDLEVFVKFSYLCSDGCGGCDLGWPDLLALAQMNYPALLVVLYLLNMVRLASIKAPRTWSPLQFKNEVSYSQTCACFVFR